MYKKLRSSARLVSRSNSSSSAPAKGDSNVLPVTDADIYHSDDANNKNNNNPTTMDSHKTTHENDDTYYEKETKKPLDIDTNTNTECAIPLHAYLILASAVLGLSSIGPSLDLQHGVASPILKIYWRMSGTWMTLIPVALHAMVVSRPSSTPLLPPLSLSQAITFVGASMCYAVMCLGFCVALTYTSVGNAVIFSNSNAILLLLGRVLMGQSVHMMQGAGALTAFLGGIFCTYDASVAELDDDQTPMSHEDNAPIWRGCMGDAIALLSALGGLMYLVLAKRVRSRFSSIPLFVFCNMFTASTVTLLYMILSGIPVEFSRDEHVGLFGWMNSDRLDRLPLEMVMVVICNLVGSMGYLRSTQYFDNLVISVATLMEPVMASMLAFGLGEGGLPGMVGWMGNALVMAGTVAVIVAPKTSFVTPCKSNARMFPPRRRRHVGLLALLLVVLGVRSVHGFSSNNRPLHPMRSAHPQQKLFRVQTLTATSLGLSNGVSELPAATTDRIYRKHEKEIVERDDYDRDLFVLATIPPILAFFFWGEISHGVAYVCDQLSFPGSNVDGNAFASNLLRPTINGVVVPATGISLGTLFATTVNVLWNRQLMLRSSINAEVCELRLLRRAIFGCFGTAQHSKRRATALGLLHSYTQTIVSETEIGSIERLERKQMNGGISMNELDELADMLHGVDGAAVSRQSSVSNAESLLISLNGHRSGRVATTLSGFPKIHWSVLSVLYFMIVLSFLVDSNQEINQYLNSIQLRVLFSIIVSVGSGASMLMKDLADPFRGSFCVHLAAQQLDSFEALLKADIAEAQSEHKQVGRSAFLSSDPEHKRTTYNTGNTLYFHLLTGPLGNNIRFLGDIVAWSIRKITSGWAALKNWASRRPSKAVA